tara:strand:- start:717 stop:869 length:153 start_codon:yes stop_codon:yes gene_type:complete
VYLDEAKALYRITKKIRFELERSVYQLITEGDLTFVSMKDFPRYLEQPEG